MSNQVKSIKALNEHILACEELLKLSLAEIEMSVKIIKEKFYRIEVNQNGCFVCNFYDVINALGFKEGWLAHSKSISWGNYIKHNEKYEKKVSYFKTDFFFQIMYFPWISNLVVV